MDFIAKKNNGEVPLKDNAIIVGSDQFSLEYDVDKVRHSVAYSWRSISLPPIELLKNGVTDTQIATAYQRIIITQSSYVYAYVQDNHLVLAPLFSNRVAWIRFYADFTSRTTVTVDISYARDIVQLCVSDTAISPYDSQTYLPSISFATYQKHAGSDTHFQFDVSEIQGSHYMYVGGATGQTVHLVNITINGGNIL